MSRFGAISRSIIHGPLIYIFAIATLPFASLAQNSAERPTIESAKAKHAFGDVIGAEKDLREVAANAQQQSEAGIREYLDSMQMLANIIYAKGDVQEYIKIHKEAQAALLASPFFDNDVKTMGIVTLVQLLYQNGRGQEARTAAEDLLRSINLATLQPGTRHAACEVFGVVLTETGLPTKGRELLSALLDEVEPHLRNDHRRLHYFYGLLARAYIWEGDFRAAAERYRDAANHATPVLGADSDVVRSYRLYAAEALVGIREPSSALDMARPVFATLEKLPPQMKLHALRTRATIRFQQRLFYDASVDLRAALKLVDPDGTYGSENKLQLNLQLADALISSGAFLQAWSTIDEIQAQLEQEQPRRENLLVYNQIRKARILIDINDQEEAAEILSNARSYLASHPDDIGFETNVGQIAATLHSRRREDAEAVRILTELLTKLKSRSPSEAGDGIQTTALLLIPLLIKSDEGKALELVDEVFGDGTKPGLDDDFRRYVADVFRGHIEEAKIRRNPDAQGLAQLRANFERMKNNPFTASPDVARGKLHAESTLLHAEGKVAEAHRLADKVLKIDLGAFADLLRYGSQHQRINALEGLQDQAQDLPALVQYPTGVLRASFYVKSALLDSLVSDTLLLDRLRPENPEFVRNLETLREEYRTLSVQPKKTDREANAARLKTLRLLGQQIEEAERKLGIQRSEDSKDVEFSVDLIRARLPAGAAVLDYVDFRSWDGVHYGVAILPKNGKPAWVDLGSKKRIDGAVTKARIAWRNGTLQEFAAATSECSQLIWMPVVKLLPSDLCSLLISPWPTLAEVPFAFLKDEAGAEAVLRFDIALLRSTRELFRLRPHSKTGNKVMLFQGGGFGGTGKGQEYFPELLGAGEEITAIRNELNKAKVQIDLVPPSEATEQRVKAARGNAVIHIASHGFFADRRERGSEDEAEETADRIFRAALPFELDGAISQGIALRGAGTTIDNRLAGNSVDPNSDGLLTIDEIASADWEGTWLAVLSTCDSGRSPSSASGRFSLVFSATRAGVENTVVCLWEVGDFSTAELMGRFYGELLAGRAPIQAVSTAQRSSLENHSPNEENDLLKHAAALTCWASGDRWNKPAPIKHRGVGKARQKK